jgi:hypothetical protein
MQKCKICKTPIVGRIDKLFCSTKCKNYYHVKLRAVTANEATEIDKLLHRNRAILLEIMGKNEVQKKIPRLLLENKKFRFKYLTHFHINSKGKTMHYVYDFGWMDFSDDEVLILRNKKL